MSIQWRLPPRALYRIMRRKFDLESAGRDTSFDFLRSQDSSVCHPSFGAIGASIATNPAAAPLAPTPPIDEPALIGSGGAADPEAIKGRAIAAKNPVVAAIRAGEPDGPQRMGFDIGMGVWQGNTADGPGKQAVAKSLTPAGQAGFADAAAFSFQWNNNARFAAQGAVIARVDPAVAAARAQAYGTRPTGLSAGLYLLGFDIATGIFGDPALGAQGNTEMGPGSEKIRATLGRDGQEGFNDSFSFNRVRR
jgi:hypothetical protein